MSRIVIILITMALAFTGSINAQQNSNNPQGLDAKQQKIVTIAAFASRGELDKLKVQLNAGLDAGLTVNQIREVLVHLYAYSGFPRSLRGLQTFMTVLDERKAKGITDTVGPEASPITDTRDKYTRGKEILAELAGTPVPEGRPATGYAGFAPEIETFLKEHLFADIFERDVLTYDQREMVTVSVLIALGDLEPMMRSHMNLSLNVGITPQQLKEMIQVIENNVSKKEADAAKPILAELLKSKNLK